MILALVRYLTLCNGCQPRTQALFSARYSRSLGTRLRRCGTSCTKRNRDYSRGVTTPRGIHQLLVCLAVPRKCNFSRNFFFQIAIRILRKVDATSTVFVTFQLPQIQRGTFCLFSILTFCLITDRRIRPLINYKPPLPPNSGKSLGICRVRVHLVILNQCMVLYIIISPSGMEVVLFFFLNRKRTSPCWSLYQYLIWTGTKFVNSFHLNKHICTCKRYLPVSFISLEGV